MKELLNILYEARTECRDELRARTDIDPSIEYSKYNQWLNEQIQEINIAIQEVLNPNSSSNG